MAYINPDIFQVDFDDLTGWTDADTNGGVSSISPAGQLYLDCRAMTSQGVAAVNKDLGTVGTGNYYIEIKFKGDVWDGDALTLNGITWSQQAGTNIFDLKIGNNFTAGDGILIYDGATYNKVYTNTWDNNWHTITFYIYNSQNSCNIWVDKSPTLAADVTAADCSSATGTDGILTIQGNGTAAGNGEYHIDYIYVGSALLAQNLDLVCETGVFTLTGIAAALDKSVSLYNIICETGNFILTGISAVLERTGIQWLNQDKSTSISPTNITKNSISPTNQTKNNETFTNASKNSISPTNQAKSSSTFSNQDKTV